MKKATQKNAAPVNLGSKRTCIKCATKFYDFNKEEISCPKCNAVMDAEDFAISFPLKAEHKRPKPSEKLAPEALVKSEVGPDGGPEPFESAEELADEEDGLGGEIEADEDENDY